MKGSPTAEEGEGLGGVGSRSVSAGKNYFAGLRKLRPKTSAGAGNAPPLPGVGVGKEAAREALTMRSVPMTQSMSVKVSKREVAKVVGVGPNRHYMTALARLCDAAQVLGEFFFLLSFSFGLGVGRVLMGVRRPDCETGRGSGVEVFVPDACGAGVEYEACGGVFCFLYLSLCAYGCWLDAG